jgi:hypothetical protein
MSTTEHYDNRFARLLRRMPTVRDGMYRMEFTYGERRGQPVACIDLAAEVFDGAGKGLQVGETFSFSFGCVTGAGNEQKIRAYAECLGVDSNCLDHEEWLLRPFLAEVANSQIVTISDGKSAFVHLPASAETPRKMVWRADAGWDFEELPRRSGKMRAAA